MQTQTSGFDINIPFSGSSRVLGFSPGSAWDLRWVVPPHSSFSHLLFQLQRAEPLLAALLAVPEMLAVLVHVLCAGAHIEFEAPHRELLRGQPGPPETLQQRGHVVLAEKNMVLLEVVVVVAWVQKVTGDDVNAVTGQGLAEGVLVAGAGEHT